MYWYGALVELLEHLADFFNFLCEKVPVNPEKNKKWITRTIGILAVTETIAKIFKPDIVRMELDFLQSYWMYIYIFIALLALLPPFMAFLDRRKAKESVEEDYIWGNLRYNIGGAVCAVMMLEIARIEIKDFRFLEDFRIESIFKILLPICLWIALSYQSAEQQSSKLNHDASLKWINQMFNILHLFNVYFWVFFSTALIVGYNIYCHINNVKMTMNIFYLVFLTIVISFFYMCAANEHEHVRFLFVVNVPVILICSIYWMSWFQFDNTMRRAQFIFILLHSLLYTRVIYREFGVMVRCGLQEEKDPKYKVYLWSLGIEKNPGFRKKFFPFKRVRVKVKSWLHIITFFLIFVAYSIFWLVPNAIQIERVEYAVAQSCIAEICMDTDKDADALVEEIKSHEWYNDERQDMDRTQFLIFVYEQLKTEMVDKGIIRRADTAVSYEELLEWSVKVSVED